MAGAYALYALYNGLTSLYRPSALWLGIFATFEICTGTILSILSANISASLVCERIALYLVLVVLIEGVLYVKMRGHTIIFPTSVISSIVASLAFLSSALALGF